MKEKLVHPCKGGTCQNDPEIKDFCDCRTELKKIELELNSKRYRKSKTPPPFRYENIRDHVDRWYCYNKGWMNTKGAAKWDDYSQYDLFSAAGLKKYLDNIKNPDKSKWNNGLRKEHVVPISVIEKILYYTKVQNLDEIQDLLKKYVQIAIITEEEDSCLSKTKISKGPLSRIDSKFQKIEPQVNEKDIFGRYLHPKEESSKYSNCPNKIVVGKPKRDACGNLIEDPKENTINKLNCFL